MTIYTIITTEGEVQVDADRFARDSDGDLYLYAEDGDDPVGHTESGRFVGIFESERDLTITRT